MASDDYRKLKENPFVWFCICWILVIASMMIIGSRNDDKKKQSEIAERILNSNRKEIRGVGYAEFPIVKLKYRNGEVKYGEYRITVDGEQVVISDNARNINIISK